MNIITSKAIESLTKTTEELVIQSEISSILNSIVSDIELTQELEQQINHDRLVAYLTLRCKNAEQALGEYKALEIERMNQRHKLGQEFLQELYHLEKQMKTNALRMETKETNREEMVETLSLEQRSIVEEDVNTTNFTTNIQRTTTSPEPNTPLDSNPVDPVHTQPASTLSIVTSEIMPAAITAETSTIPTGDDLHEHAIHEGLLVLQPEQAISQNETKATNSNKTKIQSDIPKPISIYLPSLNPKILVSIFEYLDPLEIVSTAQANKRLYSKVNGIFGLEGAVFVEDEDHEENETFMMGSTNIPNNQVDVMILDEEGEIPEEISFSSTKKNTSKPTIVSIPTRDSTKEVSQKTRLSSRPEIAKSSPKIVTTDKPMSDPKDMISTNATSFSGKSSGFQLSAAVAKSLTTKLSPVELSAIITMRDQLRQKEDDAFKSIKQFEEKSAQLEDALAVNEMLTEETNNLKRMLETVRASAAEITRQSNSDQEVIAFLDERVQELEKSVEILTKEQKQVDASIEKSKNASERQLSVLTELLTYEREQKADQERDWKYDKKVLVKEVKKCRTQIMSLEAERDGLRQENQRLKEALLSLGVAGGAHKKSFDSVYN